MSDAIRHMRLATFVYRRVEYLVEPHLFGRRGRYGALALVAWVRTPAPAWKIFTFAEIRSFDTVLHSDFIPRIPEIPLKGLDPIVSRFPRSLA